MTCYERPYPGSENKANKFKIIEINGIKPEIKTGKTSQNRWKLTNKLLNIPWAKEKVTEETKHTFILIQMKAQHIKICETW